MKPHGTYDTAFQAGAASRDAEVAALRITLVESESLSRLGYSLLAKQLIRADRLAKQVTLLRDELNYIDQCISNRPVIRERIRALIDATEQPE